VFGGGTKYVRAAEHTFVLQGEVSAGGATLGQ